MKGLGAKRSYFRDLVNAGVVAVKMAADPFLKIAAARVAVDLNIYERKQLA